jgi:hypothetical protein
MRHRQSGFSRPKCICQGDVAHRRGTPSSTVHSTNQSDPLATSNKTRESTTHFAITINQRDYPQKHSTILVLHCTFDVCFPIKVHRTLYIAVVCAFDVTLISDISYHPWTHTAYPRILYLIRTNLDELFVDVPPMAHIYNPNSCSILLGHRISGHHFEFTETPHTSLAP